MPGVRLVLTAADLERLGVGPMSVRSRMANGDGTAMVEPERTVLARAAVKYVGPPVVAVVADDEAAALAPVEAIAADYAEQLAVLDQNGSTSCRERVVTPR